MGAGNDTFVWNPGDGSDTVEGQDGTDTMQFNGSNAGEQVDLSANGNRLRFTRDVANIVMDTAGVEQVNFNALGGPDKVTLNDLSATDVNDVNVDLGVNGAGDGQPDNVIVNGTNVADAITITGGNGSAGVNGLAATVNIANAEPTNDTLTATNAIGGEDFPPPFARRQRSRGAPRPPRVARCARGGRPPPSAAGGEGDHGPNGGPGLTSSLVVRQATSVPSPDCSHRPAFHFYAQTNQCSAARRAASRRVAAPSFLSTAATWCSAVRGDTTSRSAISAFVRPSGEEREDLELASCQSGGIRTRRLPRPLRDAHPEARACARRRASSAARPRAPGRSRSPRPATPRRRAATASRLDRRSTPRRRRHRPLPSSRAGAWRRAGSIWARRTRRRSRRQRPTPRPESQASLASGSRRRPSRSARSASARRSSEPIRSPAPRPARSAAARRRDRPDSARSASRSEASGSPRRTASSVRTVLARSWGTETSFSVSLLATRSASSHSPARSRSQAIIVVAYGANVCTSCSWA